MSGDDTPVALSQRWSQLAALTPARIGLGRSGSSLPTREVLRFGLAHAQARDAVHEPLRPDDLAAELLILGLEAVQVESAAPGREDFLRRPDLGRRLPEESRAALSRRSGFFDLAIVIGDGLSATAIHRNVAPLLARLLPLLQARKLTLAPVVIATQARVALGDEVGEFLGARIVAMLIGERPGLSSPDSLGAYLTFAPKRGLTDEARNCISNIRPGGLGYEEAAFRLDWLASEALRRGLSGVGLKDESAAMRLDRSARGAIEGGR
jgi:ethanolamine ammonia-lyase small subunit